MFERQKERLLDNLERADVEFRQRRKNDAPGLYFHKEALSAAGEGNFDRFAEMAYAMLATWGMNRSGGGPSMVDFDCFRVSLSRVRAEADRLHTKTPVEMSQRDWEGLQVIFEGLQCMKTRPRLVAHSKVMAHWLPKLVPPIDGLYTLTFLYGKAVVPKPPREWAAFKEMLSEFFYPVLQERRFAEAVPSLMGSAPAYTSELKILDNLIMGMGYLGSTNRSLKRERIVKPRWREAVKPRATR